MLITKEVEIKLTNKIVSHYKALGYKCKSGETIKVKVEHLTKGSKCSVDVLCDYCLEDGIETIMQQYYQTYLRHKDIVKKDCCEKHASRKREEILLAKYQVRNPMQIKEVRDRASETSKNDWGKIIKCFSDKGYVLISTKKDYISANSKLKYICNKHEDCGVQEISYSSLKQKHGCKWCGYEKFSKSRRTSYDELVERYIKRDCKLMLTREQYEENSVAFSEISLPYICNKHKDKGIMYSKPYNIGRSGGCPWCALRSGENHHSWKGGVTGITAFLRNSLVEWKKKSMKQCKFKSVLSGKSFDTIHHIHGFELIIQEVFETTNIPIKPSVSLYTQEELEALKEECLRLHENYPLGVCLTNDEHKLFHKLYGTGGNTIEQWEEFEIRYNNNEFQEIA